MSFKCFFKEDREHQMKNDKFRGFSHKIVRFLMILFHTTSSIVKYVKLGWEISHLIGFKNN